MNSFICGAAVFLLIFPGCSKSDAQGQANMSNVAVTETQKSPANIPQTQINTSENAFNPFSVYTEKGSRVNHYVPSGFMPDGKCIKFNDAWLDGCHQDKTCIKIEYDIACSKENLKWAGIYWLNPPNNWGNQKGGFDLTGATKLSFWAKGEKGGERIEEFKIGGITGEFPDTDTGVIGPVILTSAWKQYTIDLRGKDLSYISGGFAWSTNVDVNPESCTFYLDDIQYE